MANREDIAASGLVLELSDDEHYRYMINFNIPATIQTYQNCLARIRNYIVSNFLPIPDRCWSCRFQITATYVIRLPNNNERVWTGSFYNSDNLLTVLSGVLWREFIPETFVDYVTRCTSHDHVIETLDWGNQIDTDWTFDRLLSIVVSFQVIVRFPDDSYHMATGFGNQQRGQRRIIPIYQW